MCLHKINFNGELKWENLYLNQWSIVHKMDDYVKQWSIALRRQNHSKCLIYLAILLFSLYKCDLLAMKFALVNPNFVRKWSAHKDGGMS